MHFIMIYYCLLNSFQMGLTRYARHVIIISQNESFGVKKIDFCGPYMSLMEHFIVDYALYIGNVYERK